MEEKDCTNIPIPNVMVNKVREHIKNTEFKSVSEYITFVLQEVLQDSNDANASGLTPEEEEKVKETLKRLGYL